MLPKDFFKYSLIVGLVAVLSTPFIIADSQLFPFITGKAFTFRILTEVLLGLWLIGMFFDSSIRPRFSWILGSVLIFGAVVTVADLTGMSFYKSFWSNFERMDGLVTTLHLVAYFLVAGSVLNTRSKWKYFFDTSVVASFIMSFYVFLQLAGRITINQGGVRVDGTFGNATYLAVYMMFNFFITLFLLFRIYTSGKSESKWFVFAWYVVALVCQVISIYFTATRGVILGLIGGLVLSTLVVAIFERSQPTIRKIALGGLVAIALLVGGFFMIRNTQFVTQSPTLSRFTSMSVEQISSQGRRYIWPMAWEGFKEKPILGWGQENFNYVFNKYYDPRMYAQEQWFDRAHNVVLDWLVVGGVLGLVAYFAMFIALLVLLWKNTTFSLVEKSLILGLVGAYFFQNLFVFDNQISYIYFFSLLAFIHSENTREKSEPGWLSRFSANTLVTQKILPVIVIIVTAGLIYGLNIRPISASRNLIKSLNVARTSPEQSLNFFRETFRSNTFANKEAVEQLFNQLNYFINPSVGEGIKKDYADLAIQNLDIQIEKFPSDARPLLFMGSLMNRLGDYQGALTYLEKAVSESPNKQTIIFEVGLAYLSSGDVKKALEHFKIAYDLAPDFSEARIFYAIAAIYDKNPTLTNELLAPLSVDTLALDERVVSAFASNGRMADATKLVEKRVEMEPQNVSLRFRLSAGYLALDQRAKSIEVLREVVRLFPEHKDQVEYYIKEIQAGRNP